MGGARSEVADDDDARADGGRDLDGPEHQAHLDAPGPAQRGQRPLREGPGARAGDGGAGGRDAADDRAVRRARSPGTIDVGGPRARPPLRLRDARVTALLGVADPRERRREILRALGFGTARPATGSTSTVPHWRRNDVTREADLVEEVARIDGARALPATLPRARGAAGRLTAAQRRRRRAEDALVGRGLLRGRGLELHRARARRPPAARRRRPAARASWRSRTRWPRPVGPAHDAARVAARRRRAQPSRAGADLALFESGAVYRAEGRADAAEHHAARRAARRALGPPRGAASRRPAPTSSPPRRCSEAVLETLRVEPDVEPASRSCIPGARAVSSTAARRGLARRGAPARRRALGPRGAGRGVRDRPRTRRSPHAPRRALRDLTIVPVRAPGPRLSVPAATPPPRCSPSRARAGGELLWARSRSSTSTGRAGGRGPDVAGAALSASARPTAR